MENNENRLKNQSNETDTDTNKMDSVKYENDGIINKKEYLNEWIQKIDFDDATSDSLTEFSSSVVDSEDLSEYMKNIKIENNSENSVINFKNEEIIQKVTNSLHNILHTENSSIENQGENISIQNSNNVHVGNVTHITGTIKIVHSVGMNRNAIKNKTKNHDDDSSETNNKEYFIGNIDRVIDESKLSIIKRRTWLAQRPLDDYEYIDDPVPYVIIAHTATELSLTQAESIYLVRHIQTFHIESMKFNDIAYNFLIGGEGNVYEGRNWGVVGSHTKGYNKKALGIAFIGCFMKELPPKISLNACKHLIQKGVELGYIRSDYKLLGHCQCLPFESPGRKLFEEIKTWPNFSDMP